MHDVTQILQQIESGDPLAAEQLLPLVYEELRRLAAARMANERPDHTLQATALVHEAYVRLVRTDRAPHWGSRGHFFAAAAEAMRHILVENARRHARLKRGLEAHQSELQQRTVACEETRVDLIALDEALIQLEEHDSTAAKLVTLRFFAGLSHVQAAEALGLGRRAADRVWTVAQAWLFRELNEI
ncbi:MAG: ECF-type sigma factor [Planctomycetaceae bacterium]